MEPYFTNKFMFALLDDERFFRWIIDPTPELDLYWQNRIAKDEKLRVNIMILREILEKLRVVDPIPDPEDKKLIWEKIEKEILAKENALKSKKRNWFIGISSVAAMAVLVLGLYWFFWSNSNYGEQVDYQLFAVEDEQLMKSGNVNLILSESERINIDNDKPTITYTDEGSITVDEKKITKEPEKPQLNQLIVPYGKTTSLILSDGTKVWMNSGSKLIYPSVFEKNRREVFLIGEAFLDVTKNEKAPFIIKTKHIGINVLGTELNISAYNDDTDQSVILVSGAVEVNSQELKGPYKILPNQKLSYGTTTNEVSIHKVDVNNYISWIEGYLLLKSESLSNLLQKLGRHYNVTFIYDKNEIKDIRVSGKLDLEVTIKEVLDYISLTTPIVYTIDENNISLGKKN